MSLISPQLITSTDDLVRDGVRLPGLPLFKSGHRLADAIANAWVISGATDRNRSSHTSWAYARGLRDLQESIADRLPGVPWHAATSSDVVRFASERSGKVAGYSGRVNDADGISLKLYGIDSAMKFAFSKGFIRARPFVLSDPERGGQPAGGGAVIIPPRSTVKRPKVITSDQLLAIRRKLPLVCDDARSAMDLMTLWSWGTGIRRIEVVGLCRTMLAASVLEKLPPTFRRSRDASLREAFAATTAEAFELELWPAWTKNNVGGTILVPRDLIKRSIDWMELVPLPTTPGRFSPIFVNANGLPYDPETLSRYFWTACEAARVEASFHSLRHSYATHVLAIFNARGNSATGKLFIQAQMRHANQSTTLTYTHFVEMTSHENTAFMAVNTHFEQVM